MADDSLTRFAQKHRLTAAAALLQIVKDEDASPAARQSAAEKLLAYADGRPTQARTPVTSSAVMALAENEKRVIFDDLCRHFLGDGIEALLGDLVPRFAALAKPAKVKKSKAAKPVPTTLKYGFRRGETTPRPAYIPPDWNDRAFKRPGPALPSPASGLNGNQPTPTAALTNPAPAESGLGCGAAGDGAGGGDAAGPAADPRLAPTTPAIDQLRYGLADQLPAGVMFDAFGNPTRWRH